MGLPVVAATHPKIASREARHWKACQQGRWPTGSYATGRPAKRATSRGPGEGVNTQMAYSCRSFMMDGAADGLGTGHGPRPEMISAGQDCSQSDFEM